MKLTRWAPIFLFALASLLATGSARAQQRIFLEFSSPSIQGEATTIGFEGQIDVLSVSIGAYNPACSGGKGQASFSEFNFNKDTDRASVDMLAALGNHAVFGSATISYAVNAGSAGYVTYQTYQFDNAVLSSMSHAGSGGVTRTTESWSLSFSQATLTYSFVDGTGKISGTESVTVIPPTCPGS